MLFRLFCIIFTHMKPITEYSDYRTYMRDFYEERKRVSYFTWREFRRHTSSWFATGERA